MNGRKHLLEALTLVIAAILCAVVANALAARDRKMALVGNYPNALKVPSQGGVSVPVSGTTTRFDTTANQIANTAPAATTTMRIAETNPLTGAPAPAANAPVQSVAGNQPPAATSAPPATGNRQPATAPAARGTTGPPVPALASPASPTRAPQPVVAPPENALSRFMPHEKQPYVELHGDDVALLHSRGVLFLDARRTSVYEAGHIAGAQPYSVWEADVDEKVNKLYEARGNDPKQANEPIVIYCSGGDCEDSHMLAQKLWGVQFNNVYVYKDGFPDWEKRGGAVHKGSAP
jgi:rhodanese-related sulfurtransferase